MKKQRLPEPSPELWRESRKLVVEQLVQLPPRFIPRVLSHLSHQPVLFIVSIAGEETEAPGMRGCLEVTQLVRVWDTQSLSPAPTA